VRVCLVRNSGSKVAHICIYCVAEQQHLDDWQSDDHAEREVIATQLPHLFAQDRKYA
jgi:hypothetical protein